MSKIRFSNSPPSKLQNDTKFVPNGQVEQKLWVLENESHPRFSSILKQRKSEFFSNCSNLYNFWIFVEVGWGEVENMFFQGKETCVDRRKGSVKKPFFTDSRKKISCHISSEGNKAMCAIVGVYERGLL